MPDEMKILIWVTSVLLTCFSAQVAQAQSVVGHFDDPTLAVATNDTECKPGMSPPGKRCNIFLFTATVPVSFSRLTFQDGKAQLGPELSLGTGFAFILGKASYDQEAKATVDPGLLVGAAINFGMVQTTDDTSGDSEAKGGIAASTYIGFGRVAVAGGRDFINDTWFLGLTTRIDTFSFLPSTFVRIHQSPE